MATVLMIVVLLVLMPLRVPVCAAMGLSAIVGLVTARHAAQHARALHGDRRALGAAAGDSVLRARRQPDEPVRHDQAHLRFPRSRLVG